MKNQPEWIPMCDKCKKKDKVVETVISNFWCRRCRLGWYQGV